jgi:hypothetical protein
VLVVDNASTDGTGDLLAGRYPAVEVVWLPTNTGFAGGAQAGLDAVTTEYACFLNNDAQADPGWLAALQDALDGCPDVVAATSQILLAENGRINNAGGALTRWGSGYDRGYGHCAADGFAQAADVAAFCGAAAAVRTAAPARSVAFQRSSSCTTKTPTCRGGWVGPAAGSASRTRSSTTCTPRPATRHPRRLRFQPAQPAAHAGAKRALVDGCGRGRPVRGGDCRPRGQRQRTIAAPPVPTRAPASRPTSGRRRPAGCPPCPTRRTAPRLFPSRDFARRWLGTEAR